MLEIKEQGLGLWMALTQNRRLTSNFFFLLTGNILSKVASAVAIILITRALAPEDYGIFATTLSAARISAIFFTLGLDIWILQTAGGEQTDRAQKVSAAVYIIRTSLGMIWLGSLYLIFSLIESATMPVEIIFLAGISVWLEHLALTSAMIFQARLENLKTSSINLFFNLLFLLGVTLVVFTPLRQGSIHEFMRFRGIAAFCAALMAIWLLFRTIRPRFSRAVLLDAFYQARIFAPSMGLTLLANQADVILVATFLGSGSAGFYATAIIILNTILLTTDTLHGLLIPYFSEQSKTKGDVSKKTVAQFAILGFGGSLAVTAALYLSAGWIIMLLFDNDYEPTIVILRGLAAIIPIRSQTAIFGALLVARHRHGRRLVIQTVVVLINIIGNIILFQTTALGITGVIFMYLASEIVLVIGYFWLGFPQKKHHAN